MSKQENSKQGCFSNFLKVLLCARNETSPPVYPSENVEEKDSIFNKKDKLFDDSIAPGVVARLMGLDSLPNTKRVVKKTTLDSVPRSKSVNFVDYLLKFDQNMSNHRRVKTSSSFREVPFVEKQKSYLFVLDIDDDKKGKVQETNNGVNLRKKNKEIVRVKKEKNQGKSKKISKLKDEPRRVPSSSSSKYKSKVRKCDKVKDFSSVSPRCNCSYYGYGDVGSSSSSSSISSLPNRNKKRFVEPKMRNKVKNYVSPKKIQTEHGLENLSPVSVLDVNDYAFLYGADFSGTSTLPSKSKKKSKSLLAVSLDEEGVEEKASSNKGYVHNDINKEAEYYSDLMLKVRTLSEESIRESDYKSKAEGFEEICLVFEQTILDHLLLEVLNDLVELSS